MNRIIKHQESFNTNNGWGFGGAIGTLTTYQDGFQKREGRAYFRHAGSEYFVRYFNPDGSDCSKEWFDSP